MTLFVGDSAARAKDFCFQMFLARRAQQGATSWEAGEKVSLRPLTIPFQA
jgi:hypothetical protein